VGLARARGTRVRGERRGRRRARATHLRRGGVALMDRVLRRRVARVAGRRRRDVAPRRGRARAAAHDDAHDAARRLARARAARPVRDAWLRRARHRARAASGSTTRRRRHADDRRRRLSRVGSLVRGAPAGSARTSGGDGGTVTLKITWRRVLAVVGGVVALGLLVAWSGVVNIGASTGHAAITDWFLHWAMRNTVRTYAA